MKAEQITPAVTHHGEGPVWSPAWGGLRFVDTYVGDIMHLGREGVVDRWHVAETVTSIRPRRDGGLSFLPCMKSALRTNWVDGCA